MRRRAIAVSMLATSSYLWGIGIGFLITIIFGRTSDGIPLLSMTYYDALREALLLIGNNMIAPNSAWGIILLIVAHPLFWLIDVVLMLLGILLVPKDLRYDTVV